MSQATNVTQASHLLKLPMELLEMVANQVDTETSILHMRLTCKELSAAAFKTFAAEYIDVLSCFMLDPERLLRAKHITSTPHLARRITFFSFESGHLECREDTLAAVPNQGEDYCKAVDSIVSAGSQEAYAVHGDALKAPSAMHLALVRSILRDLKHMPNCGVGFSAHFPRLVDGIQHHSKPNSFSLPAMCLEIAQQVDCGLTALQVTDRCILDAAAFEAEGRLCNAVKGITRIDYTVYPESYDDLASERSVAHIQAVRSLIKAAVRLDTLKVEASFDADCSYQPGRMSLVSQLTKDVALSTLTDLQLCYTQLSLEDMLDILQSCKTQLRDLVLDNVDITHFRPPWMAVFRSLQESCNLERLYVEQPSWTNEIDCIHHMQFRISDEDNAELLRDMKSGPAPATGFLELNLRRGLVYTEE